jgi:dihydrofolate synthase/folylpolyglutamate synthase
MKKNSEDILARLHGLHPSQIDLSLERINRLLEALGRPQDKLPAVIHIAGTNGKGSVLSNIGAILGACGKKVHTYTSPHLVSFHERIRLADEAGGAGNISEKRLVDLLLRVEKANDGEPITFFEITTATAFLAFAEHPADYLLLETGLGGRFDATNIVEQPVLTVITNISSDHTEFLGESLAEIAFEKAGILKPGVPCISAPQEPDVLQVLRQRAEELRAPLKVAGEDYSAYEQLGRFLYEEQGRLLALPMPRLIGVHQVINAGTAIAAVLDLEGCEPSQQELEAAMNQVVWPARLQRIDNDSLPDGVGIHPLSEVWLDGGHNRSAAEALAMTMADLEEQSPRPLHLILGMMRNKDAERFIETFQDLCEMVFTVPVPATDQGWPADELAAIAEERGIRATECRDVVHALNASAKQARTVDDEPVRVLICGSLYLAGHVLEISPYPHAI